MLSTKEFIQKAKIVHKNLYTYKKTAFINWKTKLIITCPTHSDFHQMPQSHLSGNGCKKCAVQKQGNKRTQKASLEFKSRSVVIHGNKYDYSKVKYENAHTKVQLYCRTHKILFEIKPCAHLRGSGCSQCGVVQSAKKRSGSNDTFIEGSKKIHGLKYNYSKVNYISSDTPVKIICPNHGIYLQRPNNHLLGQGCSDCGTIQRANKRRQTKKNFVNKANSIHESKYDYSKVVYKGAHKKVIIICSEHGEFLQKPSDHLGSKSGCPFCIDRLNSSGVRKIIKWLTNNEIEYEREKTFPDLKSNKKGNKSLRFDFFIPSRKILIEFDGLQHFKPVIMWGGEKSFQNLLENDKSKNNWSKKKGYKLIRITFKDEQRIDKILSNYFKKY